MFGAIQIEIKDAVKIMLLSKSCRSKPRYAPVAKRPTAPDLYIRRPQSPDPEIRRSWVRMFHHNVDGTEFPTWGSIPTPMDVLIIGLIDPDTRVFIYGWNLEIYCENQPIYDQRNH